MAKANPSPTGLDLTGQISLLVDDVPCVIDCRGDKVVLVVADMKTALDLRRKLSSSIARLPQVVTWLQVASLTLEVEVAGRCLGQLGSEIRPNWVAKVLGLSPFHIPAKALSAALTKNFWRGRSS